MSRQSFPPFSMQASPPKPWERSAQSQSSTSVQSTTPQTQTPASSNVSSTTSTSNPLTVPTRPTTLGAQPLAMSSAYNNPLSSPYSSYNSPYSRFGSTYSPYGGGLYGAGGIGTYGGGYGAYGGMNSMYGGMPGMGMGMYGPANPFDPNNPSLTQTIESTTQHTFALLHSIVQTFTGVSQMLESTFMATHSSFFAMVGVIEQFGQLRNALGSVLGLFGLVRWLKELLTGRPQNQMQVEFREFINGKPVQGPMPPPGPKPSRKPLIIFLVAIFGVPYAMHKLIKILTERAQQQQMQNGQILPPLDPTMLTFARALYPFTPSSPAELELKENEIVAIMSKLDPTTGTEIDPRMEVETDWWKGRTRDGREGWFPKKWVQVLEKKQLSDNKSQVEAKNVD